jgi:SWI/SNF-related matrix-associated actin-dependent regulator of chromatin subfamily A-like protein 1
MATKKEKEISEFGFKMCVADEVHYLKSRDAKRVKTLVPILQRSKRVILLSGTPVLAKPVEIYNTVKIIRPDVIPSFFNFAQRYCNPTQGRYGMEYNGATCTAELHFMLQSMFMIRRLKKDVLEQLPDKRRQKIEVTTDPKYIKEMN